jgi:wyosine [tRNA(Phe)-imidazoG37] synthetase (radical SAM superfamily)
MKYRHLFGPVVSRRLGLSLGVDVIPYKYCSLNCIYCEVSKTTHLTLKRKAFFNIQEITDELDDFLAAQPKLDYITFSGAGEPTLNSSLGEIVRYIKVKYPQYKLALITNSTLLGEPEVQGEVNRCDLVMPSLDAISEDCFQAINRPCYELTAYEIVQGLEQFRQEYKGQIWLEIFIVPGFNDNLVELELLKEAVGRIKPDKVQLNSLDRPGTEAWVETAGYGSLEDIKALLQEGSTIPVEIIARAKREGQITRFEQEYMDELISLIQQKEHTKQELAKAMEIHVNEVSKLLQHLDRQDNLTSRRTRKGILYIWKD